MTTEHDLDSALRNVEQAYTAAAKGVAGLRMDSGLPFFSDPEMQAQSEARFIQPLQVAVERAHELAGYAEAEAKQLDATRFADPWAQMPTEDLQRAESLRPRIAEFTEDATGPELSGRLSWIGLHGSPVEKLLYFELAARRTDVIADTRQALDQLIDPRLAKAAIKAGEQAAALRKKSATVAVRSSQLLAEVDGTLAASEAKRRREYAQYF